MTTLFAVAVLALGLVGPAQPPTTSTSQPPAPDAQRPNPCDAPEFRQFEFWIGEWDVTGPAGGLIGSNIIKPIAGNCGLLENWTGNAGGAGNSVNTYHQADGKWHQAWVGTGGGLLELEGNFVDGKMVLEGTRMGPNQQDVWHRITWTPLDGGRVRQFWESSSDKGATWTPMFDGLYTKKKS